MTNTGRVRLVERFLASLGSQLDLRDFPLDSQPLLWRLRSSHYPESMVRLQPASRAACRNASALAAQVRATGGKGQDDSRLQLHDRVRSALDRTHLIASTVSAS